MPPKRISTAGLCIGLLTLVTSPSLGATLEYSAFPGALVTDDDANGTVFSTTVAASGLAIDRLSIHVTLEGAGVDGLAFNGDYYLRLTHTDPFGYRQSAILMNRPGRTADNPFGYDDNGFTVTFSSLGGAGDVHAYRSILFGDDLSAIPSPGRLTGIWQEDGRETDPAFVTLDSPRTAMLSSFQGVNADGVWSLYIADLSPGGEGRVTSWGMTIAFAPEPAGGGFVVAAVLCLGALWRHARSRPGSGAGRG